MTEKEQFVYVQTFGCQMNLYDTDRMFQVLGKEGYTSTQDPSQADLILLNTCSVRDKAEQKMLSALGRFHPLKQHNDDLVLGVTGCVATQEKDKLLKKVPYLDLVIGPDNIAALPDVVRKARQDREGIAETKFYNKKSYDWIPVEPQNDGEISAMLTIMKGCNKFCSFCIVPFTRGREVSKPADLIVEEVRRLVDNGVKEVTLLGQNVNSYGLDRPGDPNFAELLTLVDGVTGLERLRFTTSHPWDCTDQLIECFDGRLSSLCEYFHLPVQSGSDDVLKMMRRGYTIDTFKERMLRLKEACPDISLSTDIIVGFPGETEAQLEETLDLLREVKFERIFSFSYSERPGTAAARVVDDIPREVKAERLRRVQAVQAECTAEMMQRYDGQVVEVLVEGPSKKAERASCTPMFSSQMAGRTRTNVVTNFSNDRNHPVQKGDLVKVHVDTVYPHSLAGKLLDREDAPSHDTAQRTSLTLR